MSGPDAVIEIWGNPDEEIQVDVEGPGRDRARAALRIHEGEVVEADLVLAMPEPPAAPRNPPSSRCPTPKAHLGDGHGLR